MLNKFFGKKTAIVDPTKPDPNFVPKVDHLTLKRVPEKYSGKYYDEGDPANIKYDGSTEEILDSLVKNMDREHWKKLSFTGLLASKDIINETNYINTYTLLYADQIELVYNTDKFYPPKSIKFIDFIRNGCPLKQDSNRPVNISDALRTMMWSLRVQNHMDRIFHDLYYSDVLKTLSGSLSECAKLWRAASEASTDEPTNYYIQEVYRWLTTPLTNLMYELATSPVDNVKLEGFNQTSFYYPYSKTDRKPFSVASKKQDAKNAVSKDESRQNAISFLKVCGDSADSICYQGPVWYKQAMQRFLMLLEKVTGEKEDSRYTWWKEHLLQVLPYHMVGPWAEDYFMANCKEFTGSQASNWAYWSTRNGISNMRVYDVAVRNPYIVNVPPRSIQGVLEKTGTSSLPQICREDPSTEYLLNCKVRRLIAKKPGEGVENKGGAAEQTKKDVKRGISDAALYFEKFTKCLDFYMSDRENPESHRFEAPIKVTYKGVEAGIDQKGLLKGFLTDYMKCFVCNDLGIFTEVKEGVVDIRARKDPHFIDLFAILVAKFLQLQSRPPVYFSEELNNLIMSVDPPSAEECIEYAYHHFDDVFIKKNNCYSADHNWEPSIPHIAYKRAKANNRFFRTIFGIKTAGLEFDCGIKLLKTETEIENYNRRVLIHFEWYMKRLRQVFQDSFYFYLTRTGLAYFTPSWMMQQAGAPPPDIQGLLNCLASDPKCLDLTLKDSEGNSYNHLEALKKALVDLKVYSEFLWMVTNTLAAPPGGFYKGYIKITCSDERSKSGGPLLPTSGTCFNTFKIPKQNTLDEFKNSLKIAINNTSESNYAEKDRGGNPDEYDNLI